MSCKNEGINVTGTVGKTFCAKASIIFTLYMCLRPLGLTSIATKTHLTLLHYCNICISLKLLSFHILYCVQVTLQKRLSCASRMNVWTTTLGNVRRWSHYSMIGSSGNYEENNLLNSVLASINIKWWECFAKLWSWAFKFYIVFPLFV